MRRFPVHRPSSARARHLRPPEHNPPPPPPPRTRSRHRNAIVASLLRPMRFFEYESRAIVARAGIPVTKHGFAKTPEDAAAIAEDIGGPVVIKSQVLTGGAGKGRGGPI